MVVVDNALRELAANLLRVTRGSGRPHYIGRHARALVDALIEYRDIVGHFPSPEELANALAIEPSPERIEQMSDEEFDQFRAKHSIVRGALQIVASRLLDQKTHITVGENEMYRGLYELEVIRAGRRKGSAATARTAEKGGPKRDLAEMRPARNGRKKPKP